MNIRAVREEDRIILLIHVVKHNAEVLEHFADRNADIRSRCRRMRSVSFEKDIADERSLPIASRFG